MTLRLSDEETALLRQQAEREPGSATPIPGKQLPGPQEHRIQHRLGEATGVGVLLPQLNVTTPKTGGSS